MAKQEPTTKPASAGSNETHTDQPTAAQLERERLAREAEEKAAREAEERRLAREAAPDRENEGIDDTALLLKSRRPDSDDRRARLRRPKEAGDDSLYEEPLATLEMPDAFKDRQGVELLMQACRAYNLNPDPRLTVYIHGKHEPDPRLNYREILAWRFYEGSGSVPDKVVIVTAGGAKLAYPPDAASFDVLRNVFKAFTVDPLTKQLVPGELPQDLALPIETVMGIPITDRHILRRGYLREGGRAGADRRDAAEKRGLSDSVAVPGQRGA